MHVAVIMDGNGRWASQRGLPRTAGHEAGARAVRKIVEAAARADVDILTLYAFSSDNWSRPAGEVANLMRLFRRYLQSETAKCIDNGVRINVIGRRDRLDPMLVKIIERAETVTADVAKLTLRLAVDYSARDIIARAANAIGDRGFDDEPTENHVSIERFAERLAAAAHSKITTSDVDLLIRTGGEQRLSDFLLWECAYAELVFSRVYWPDFDEQMFNAALDDYRRRERRFGGLPAVVRSSAQGAHQ